MQASLREVKSQLSRFGQMAHEGQRITVSKHGKPWFDLVPHRGEERRIKPLRGVKPLISAKAATAPVDSRDLEGWV